MNKKIYCFLLIGIILSNAIVTIKQNEYTLNDFYQEYGKKEWDNASLEQKKELANDFINRRIAALEATAIGLHNKPDIAKKLYDRYSIALVNTTYEDRVAKPLISNELLDKTKKHIVEERLLSHILIGHNASRSQENSDRSLDEAFLLAQKIHQKKYLIYMVQQKYMIHVRG